MMIKDIKKLTVISILSIVLSSCTNENSCSIQPKNIETISESLNTLNTVSEKLEIDGKTIESTYVMISVSDNRAVPAFLGNKGCENTFTVRLLDSKIKTGLFKDYTLDYYWYYNETTKKFSEGNRLEYHPNNTSARLIGTASIDSTNEKLVIRIKNKTTNKSYLLKSTYSLF